MGSGAFWKGVVRVVFCCPGSGLVFGFSAHGRPGGDRLSRALSRSTIGAEGFHGRVRDGIGWGPLAVADRKSGGEGKSVAVRVESGGGRISRKEQQEAYREY